MWNINRPQKLESLNPAGLEHWVGIWGEEDGTKWGHPPHFDKDEGGHSSTNKIISPIQSIVYYPIEHGVEGGELQIWNLSWRQSDPMIIEGDGSEDSQRDELLDEIPSETIKPKFNRLVIFNGEHLHAINKITKGVRYAVSINPFSQKPTTFKNSHKYEI